MKGMFPMSNFFLGLLLAVMGFGIYQFSHLFNLYPAMDKNGVPWPYRILQVASYLLMGAGIVVLVMGLQ